MARVDHACESSGLGLGSGDWNRFLRVLLLLSNSIGETRQPPVFFGLTCSCMDLPEWFSFERHEIVMEPVTLQETGVLLG